jgi:uroporphyrinogen-III synthase
MSMVLIYPPLRTLSARQHDQITFPDSYTCAVLTSTNTAIFLFAASWATVTESEKTFSSYTYNEE